MRLALECLAAFSLFFFFFLITLILGVYFLHERNAPLQIERKRFHQVQILFHIINDDVARVAVGRVQHCGSL